jgi:hypothetical protein
LSPPPPINIFVNANRFWVTALLHTNEPGSIPGVYYLVFNKRKKSPKCA